ncbi:MAG: hypothetical protein SNG27_02325 [Rikenellaceae bacterium]
MKNTSLILTSLVGGAIIGSALTCLLKSAKGVEMRSEAHKRIIKELKHLHAHLAGGMCNCSENGECSCSMDKMKEMESMKSMEGMEPMVATDQNNG